VITRRSAARGTAAALATPWLFTLAGCDKPPAAITGGFIGTHPERGHRLRDAKALAEPEVTRRVHTLIAGGGVAGLSATRALRLQGLDDIALLELEDEAGGNARGAEMGGMRHPLGAHYLPVPSDSAPEVQDFLEELGIRQRVGGRWRYDERALCHAPQERLFFNGVWQEGLLPTQAISAATREQYARFAQLIAQWQQTKLFQIPRQNRPWAHMESALTAINFIVYLTQQQLDDPQLLWYLDYCCRDDYGAGIDTVSAWAGIHYFAARHGFSAPGLSDSQRDGSEGVLTWPEGNAHLTRALSQPLGARVQSGRVVLRIREDAREVQLDALNVHTQQTERWIAQRCIVALPIFVAARVVQPAPEVLTRMAAAISYSSWLVAHLRLDAPLLDTGGAHPAWDNVIYGSRGLGYVDAMHQSTRVAPGATVLTYYQALGVSAQARRDLLSQPWSEQRDAVLADIATAHPDIHARTRELHLTRYGHAMAVPTPQFLKEIGSEPIQNAHHQLSKSEQTRLLKGVNRYPTRPVFKTPRLSFAHSDWAGYSVFEEAFTMGLHAAS
jgi:monoamine oxidase